MKSEHVSRRQFLENAALAAGVVVLGSRTGMAQQAPTTAPTAAAAVRTASDLVPLGNTGLKLTRLGIGLGSSNGAAQAAGGQEKFNSFIRHAYDQGITMFDTAANYQTFRMMGPAIKGLPREKLFIQSKIEQPDNILAKIDQQRQLFNTDYVDTMLVHIQFRANWLETWKQALDGYNEAKDKKWIKARGVSCHSLPALRASTENDWTEVHLVRVNHQGYRMDSEAQIQDTRRVDDIQPVLAELKKMREKKRGVIGMKIFGGGQMRAEADREASLRYVLNMPEVDSVIIGFNSTDEMDAGIKLMNKVLAEKA